VPKKVVHRATVKRKVVPLASPSPKWPPQGFKYSDGIYAKVPSGGELVSLISAEKKLALAIQKCEKTACGAVLVAADTGCLWWEIDSSIYGPSSADPTKLVEYGNLRTTALGTKAKVISTILLLSSEPLANSVTVKNITAKCWTSPAPEKVPNNTYLPNATR
ncbi:MAG: hypothetical protein WCH42_06665, partial [Actinomycetes bacterium]